MDGSQAEVEVLRQLVARRYDDYVGALQEMVDLDCGSYTSDGVNRIAELCAGRFSTHGWTVERIGHHPMDGDPRLGDLLIGRLEGRGGPSLLMIGHMDTVFEEGTAAERPFRIEGDRAFGPGVSDMKGGLLAGFFAAEALQEAGLERFGRLTFVCNPDEEIGSVFSGPLIRELAAEADAALVLECARENGDIVSARKGVSDYRVEVVGRAAHAGVNPDRGRNAVLEAAHKTIALQRLHGAWPGVSVNVGVVSGGTRPNVVPDRCVLELDVRSPVEETLRAVEAEIERIAAEHTVPDVRVEVRKESWHRPMEKRAGGAALVALASAVAADLGFELGDTATGGASDGNTTSAAGVPTLDGLGPIGGDAHSPEEWLDLASVVPRVALLAGLIARVGAADPPIRKEVVP